MSGVVNGSYLDRRRFLMGMSAVSVASIVAGSACAAPQDWSAVEAAAKVAIDQKMTPGLGLSVHKNGQKLYEKGFGIANLETQTKVTPQSVFRIASVTKQFIGALLLILEREGKLRLDQTLSVYFPDFPRSEEVTLFQLATHTAGLANYPSQPTAPRDERLDYYDEASFLELMQEADPLYVSEPGQAERYSNTGYGLLTLIINRVCDDWYGTVLRERIFDSLGLTSLSVDQAVEIVPNRVTGYMPIAGQPTGFITAPYISMSYVSGAGALRSTANDLCLWHQALLRGELLTPAELKRFTAPVSLPDGPSYYGLGIKSRETFGTFRDQNTLSHGGRLNGFASHLWSFPKTGVSVSLLLNSDGGQEDGFARAFDKVRDTATEKAGVIPTVSET